MTLKAKVANANGTDIRAVTNLTVISEDSLGTFLFNTAEVGLHGQVVQYEPY